MKISPSYISHSPYKLPHVYNFAAYQSPITVGGVSKSGYWIDLQKTVFTIPGSWVWSSSGEPVEYMNWAPGNPEKHKKHVVMLKDDFKWNDRRTRQKCPYICERDVA